MIPNLLTLFMNIDPTVWVLASVALMVEAKEHFATVLTKGGSVVGVLLKDVHDARVQLGALLLLNFSMFRQPVGRLIQNIYMSPREVLGLTRFLGSSL